MRTHFTIHASFFLAVALLSLGCKRAPSETAEQPVTPALESKTNLGPVPKEPEPEPIGPLLCKIDGEKWYYDRVRSSGFGKENYLLVTFENMQAREEVQIKYQLDSKKLFDIMHHAKRIDAQSNDTVTACYIFRPPINANGKVEGDFGSFEFKEKKGRDWKVSGFANKITLEENDIYKDRFELKAVITDLKFDDIDSYLVKPRKR